MLLQQLSATFESVDDKPLTPRRRQRGVRTAKALGATAIPLCSRELVFGTTPRAQWAALLLGELAGMGHGGKVRTQLRDVTRQLNPGARGVQRANRVFRDTRGTDDGPRPVAIQTAPRMRTKAAADHRTQAAVRAELGLRDLASGLGADATEHLQAAIALDPDNPDHLWNLAAAQNTSGCAGTRYLALTSFRAIAAPSSARARIARQTVEDFERKVRLRYGHVDPVVVASADQQCTQGERLTAQGKLSEALILFESAIAVVPEHARAWTELGLAHRQLGHVNAASQALRRATGTHTADPRAHAALAELALAELALAELALAKLALADATIRGG